MMQTLTPLFSSSNVFQEHEIAKFVDLENTDLYMNDIGKLKKAEHVTVEKLKRWII